VASHPVVFVSWCALTNCLLSGEKHDSCLHPESDWLSQKDFLDHRDTRWYTARPDMARDVR